MARRNVADPTHTRKFSKDDAIRIAEQSFSCNGKDWKLEEPMSRLARVKDQGR